MRKPADGSSNAERLATVDGEAYLTSAQGNTGILHFREALSQLPATAQRLHLAAVDLSQTAKKVAPLIQGGASSMAGALSPNGRLLAYGSDETGRPEVYVRDFPGLQGRWQISTAGGQEPHWAPDGRELYYRHNDLFMAVSVDTGAAFQASTPSVLFKGVYNVRDSSNQSYAVDPKGGRFLMIRSASDDSERSRVRVVLNWSEELKQRVPTR